jgi:integrase
VTTLADLVTRSQKLAGPTKKLYLRAVDEFVAFAGDDPARWTPLVVESFRDYLTRAGGMKATSANALLRGLRYAGRRWAALGLGGNFAAGAEYARVEGKAKQQAKRQGLVEAELDHLLEATSGERPPDLRDRAILMVGIRCGGRRASELAGLTWDAIDGPNATFHCKGGYDLTVPLDVEARIHLDRWQEWLTAAVTTSGGPVFHQLRERLDGRWEVGGGLSRQAVWQILRDRGVQAGLKRKLHPHLLRHTFIGMAEAAGMLPQDIMRMTGHRSLQTLSGYISAERFTERSLVQLPPFTRGR